MVRDVDLVHVLAILTSIWSYKTETATRLRGRIEQVLDRAATRGHRDGLNPARWKGHLDKLLLRPSKIARVKHRAALAVAEVGPFMKRLREAEGIGARALEFAILTAAKTGADSISMEFSWRIGAVSHKEPAPCLPDFGFCRLSKTGSP